MSLTNSARILYGSPLSHPRNAVFTALVLLVFVFASTSVLVRNFFSTLSPAALQIFAISFLASLLLAIVPLSILWFLDRREPESRSA